MKLIKNNQIITRLSGILITFWSLICTQMSFAVPPTQTDVDAYIASKTGQALSNPPTVNAPISGNLPFQGGNSIAGVAKKMAGDWIGHVEDFYSGGMRWAIIGLCKDGFSIYPYQKYYYPYEMFETASIYQGEYTTNITMALYKLWNSLQWYTDAENEIPNEIGRAAQVAFSNNPLAGLTSIGSTPDLSVLNGLSAQAKGDFRSTNHDIQRQYSYFAPLAHTFNFPKAPLGNCHDVPNPAFSVRSESPTDIVSTHLTGMSDLMFPAEMAQMRLNPGTCIGHDVYKQVTPASPFGTMFLPAEERDLCVERLGSHFPITVRMTNTRSFGTAARLSYLRGDNYFRHAVSNPNKQDFHYSLDPAVQSPHLDYIQWHQPSHWPSSYSEKIGDHSDFRGNGYRPDVQRRDPMRATATTWKYIRCCVAGKPWIGPKPERKGLHGHSRQRY